MNKCINKKAQNQSKGHRDVEIKQLNRAKNNPEYEDQ